MRKIVLPIIIICSGIILVSRLFYLQIIDDSFKSKSNDNAIKIKYQYAERGYVYDRNGKILISNQPCYDVMVIPKEIRKIDTLLFCKLLNITKEEYEKQLSKAVNYSPRLPSVFLPELTKEEYAAFQEKIRNFQGFYIQKRYFRDYQVDVAANVFGYITQVTDKIIEKEPYYKSGDLIGMQGIEQMYEDVLRGRKGVKYIQRDRFNREIGPYKKGQYDTLAVQGDDIHLTLDIELQKYGEALMINKRGGIVAIEPKTGEILALVTAPSYDPALLIGRKRSENYTHLYRDSIAKPLYDRGLLAEYVPGSPFKILTALIGLQEKVIDEKTTFYCNYGFYYGKNAFMKCHDHGSFSLNIGIAKSCNTYFASVYRKIIDKYSDPKIGMDVWNRHLKSFGLGQFLGYDLPPGRKGHIPDSDFYDKVYSPNRWGSSTVISNAIGQGEVLTTPIQLANIMATVANEGYYYTPHVIKAIKNHPIDKNFTTKHTTTINKEYFKPIIQGLFDVYNMGTASWFKVNGIDICGKTGTAENFTKINGKKVQLTDHSIFVAFAPKDDPKIAIAVFVENGYWGARYAAPITSLMIEKYLKGAITRNDLEWMILNSSLEHEYAKPLSGKPFSINY